MAGAPLSAELRLIQQMARSKYWRWVHSYLLDRLNALLDEELSDPTALAVNRGAMREVRRLLKGPELVAAFLTAQQAREEGGHADVTPPTPGAPDPWWQREGRLDPGGDPLE